MTAAQASREQPREDEGEGEMDHPEDGERHRRLEEAAADRDGWVEACRLTVREERLTAEARWLA